MKAAPLPGSFPLIAHQGGWDEILLVGAPLALIGLALWAANKRVTAQVDAQAETTTGAGADAEGQTANSEHSNHGDRSNHSD